MLQTVDLLTIHLIITSVLFYPSRYSASIRSRYANYAQYPFLKNPQRC